MKHEAGHHQFKQSANPTLHHQQRWGQAATQHTLENQMQNQEQSPIRVTSRSEQPVGTTYIIPLVVEGSDKKTMPNMENKIGKAARM